MISETKVDDSFPLNQFMIDGYASPFRIERSSEGESIIIYVREDILAKRLGDAPFPKEYEGMFIEINLRSHKSLLFGGYNNQKVNILSFLKEIREKLNIYTVKYEDILLLGDFNSEVGENEMSEFCEDYNLKNLVEEPTCFKNPENPSCIDLILTNKKGSFCDTKVIETGL